MALAGPPPELRRPLTRISEAEMELYYRLLRAAARAEAAAAAGESRRAALRPWAGVEGGICSSGVGARPGHVRSAPRRQPGAGRAGLPVALGWERRAGGRLFQPEVPGAGIRPALSARSRSRPLRLPSLPSRAGVGNPGR